MELFKEFDYPSASDVTWHITSVHSWLMFQVWDMSEHKMIKLTHVMEVRNWVCCLFSAIVDKSTLMETSSPCTPWSRGRGGQNQKHRQPQNSSYYKLNHCGSFINCRAHQGSQSLTMIAASCLLSYHHPNISSAVKNKRVTRWIIHIWLYL